jgi:tight adherence protein C
MSQMVFFICIGFTAFCMAALLLVPVLVKPSPEAQRIMDVVTSARPDERMVRNKEKATEMLLEMARNLRAKLGLTENRKLKSRLQAAGMRSAGTADVFFTVQLGCPLVGLFAGSFIHTNTFFWAFALAIVGFMGPDMWLSRMVNARKMRIRKSLPDAMDMLVICVDAGLGIDQALLRVGEELAVSYPDINEEFTQVHLEQRAGKPRLEAWESLSQRTQIEEFASFVAMLVQTDRFGTPIGKALSRFSEDLRMKRRQHAEEAAAKTKIKIIFPLVLCIFPCIFIVLLAPAVLSIMDGLTKMGS